MKEEETRRLLEKFKNLPQTMKEAIISTDIDNAVLDIAKKNSLLLPEAGQLDNEIVLVLIGEKQASDFIKNIEKEIGLPKEKATSVGKDVNEMIFEKVREKMKAQKPEGEIVSGVSMPKKIDIKKAEPSEREEKIPLKPIPTPQATTVQKVGPEKPMTPPENMAAMKPEVVTSKGPEKQSLGISSTTTPPPIKPQNEQKNFLKENISNSSRVMTERPEPVSTSNIAEQKLAGSMQAIRKEVEKPVLDNMTDNEKKRPTGGQDPYRESIDDKKDQ